MSGSRAREPARPPQMKLGIALGRLAPERFLEVTLAGEQLGYESVWIPEHLVLPSAMSGSPHPGATHPPIPPETPVFDAFAYLAFLAGRTRSIRLGTGVFNIGLRHPFVTARAVQTLDVVSGGRAELGVGASWLEAEWRAVGLDFATRGRRVDEAIEVCKRLWTEPEIAHHGEHFAFDAVRFEPKPVQRPWPPISIGGESERALDRAARLGDGWIGMSHDLESAARRLAVLRSRLEAHGRSLARFEVSVTAHVHDAADLARWRSLGVTRLVVAPWKRSRDAVEALARLSESLGLEPRAPA